MSCAIIVLGSPNDQNGDLLPIAISRCERVLSEYKSIDDCKVLCTGGFGESFNTTDIAHGRYVQDYLQSRGVPSTAFLEIALSAFTIEDATLSEPILVSNGIKCAILVTSDFHMRRAKSIFNHVLPSIEFKYAEADTLLPDAELQRLIQHETIAIKRDLSKLKKLM